jgi:hypothetical protein
LRIYGAEKSITMMTSSAVMISKKGNTKTNRGGRTRRGEKRNE